MPICLFTAALRPAKLAALLIFFYQLGENIPLGDTSSWVVTEQGSNGRVVLLYDGYGGMNAPEGQEYLHIGDYAQEGGIAQSFATAVGRTYDLSLFAWNWSGMGDGYIDITVGDLVVDDLSVPDYGSGATLIEYSFTAVDTTSTLHLYDNPGGCVVYRCCLSRLHRTTGGNYRTRRFY